MAITITSLTPTNPSVFAGQSITFAITASTNISGGTLTYDWQVSSNGISWSSLPSNGFSSITITNVPITADQQQVRCVLTEFSPYTPVTTTYNVVATGSTAWSFTGLGNNPPLSATTSDTVRFDVSSTNNNTFYLKTINSAGAANALTTGVTNNGTLNNSSTPVRVTWNTSGYAAGTYYYVAGERPSDMFGPITLSPATSSIISQVNSNEFNPPAFQRTLTVLSAPTLVVTENYLPSYTVATGSTQTFTVIATTSSNNSSFINTIQANVSPIAFQWQQSTDGGSTWSNVTLSGTITQTDTLLSFATTPVTYFKQSVLTLSSIPFSLNARRFRCQVTYTKDTVTASNSPVTTDTVSLFVNPQIIITKQPGTGTDTTSTISYNTNITGSGDATFSITAFTTSSGTISYSWEYAWSDSTDFLPILTSNPQNTGTPFQLVSGTTANGPILQLSRTKLRAADSSTQLYIRCRISGLSGETTVTSSIASLYLTQTPIFFPPGDQSAIEDKYGPIPNRDAFPELQNTITVNAGVDVSIDTGIRGPITLGWQRKYVGESTWTDVGTIKNDNGTDSPPATSTSTSSAGLHTFTTPPLRRNTDHLSQYRLYCIYLSGPDTITAYSNPCTFNIFRTVYIDNNPGNAEVFENSIASFSITASPSSGTVISYSWEYSIDGTTWSPIVDNAPLLNVNSITFVNYTATVTCSSAHGLVAGDRVYISGATPLTYNGVFTVLSTGLTATQFSYTMLSIPTGNAVGPFNVHKNPKFIGINTSALLIEAAANSILQRFYRCVMNVPDSLASVQSSFGVLTLRTDRFVGITSINDKQVQEFNSVSWTITATSTSLSTPAYQWQKSTNYNPSSPGTATWNNITGANSSTFLISSVATSDAAYYRCQVTSAGSVVSFSNVARLEVFPVRINITTNTPTSVSIDEDFVGTTLSVVASSTTPGTIQYQWQLKASGTSTWTNAPVGFNQTNANGFTYRILAPSRTINNGDAYRCALTIVGNPNTYYTNETVVTVNRIFNYYSDAAIKVVTSGSTLVLDLAPIYTGVDIPTYQWQASTNGGSSWFNLSDGVNGPLYNINIDGALSSSMSLFNVPSTLSTARFRCAVSFNQVTVVKYYRSIPITLPISPAGSLFYTATIQITVTTGVIPVQYYGDQRQKVGAAIGTVVCVPKPANYLEDPSATTDDADRWKIALTGQLSTGSPAPGVNANTAPYGPNDRFPGFIEMRGQLLKAQDFPELARILGNTYGGNIPSSRQYPNYQSTDVFRLPCPYGKYLLGTGNVNNNRSSPSVVPLYAPDGSSGGQIGTAGSMGGEYNFEKYDQLPPGSPNISGEPDGTAPTVSPYLFTVGTFKTDGWERCTIEAETQFVGNTSYVISDTSGMGRISLSTPPGHTHRINAIVYSPSNRTGNFGGEGDCGARQSFSAFGQITEGPDGIISNTRNPSRVHSHAISFDPNDSTLGQGSGAIISPPSGGGGSTFSFTSPGIYSFVTPAGSTGFTFVLTAGSGGGGGNDAGNPGSAGGASAKAFGSCTNIPGGSSIRVVVGRAGGGGTGCVAGTGAGTGGNSSGTGFGGGRGGNAGGSGCSGGGGGGGGTTFMFCESVGSGPNPAGLQVGTLLAIVGGGGGGGGSGFHRGVTNPRFDGGAASTSWASSSITSSNFYSNQAALQFIPYGQSVTQSGKQGGDRSGDGGGGGGGGGGFQGGAGGAQASGDVNAPAGSGGTSAYNGSFFSTAPTLTTGNSGGAAGGSNNGGVDGSASITIDAVVSVPGTPATGGGVGSADHGDSWGVLRGSANQFLSETIIHQPDTTGGSTESLNISFPSGTATMSVRSRSNFDNYLSFYLRNNESIALQQPYFRLKYLIKAF